MAGLADAATDRVSINQAPALTAWSVCAWVKPTASASFSPVVRVEAGGGTAMVFGMKGLTPSLYSAASTTGINGTAQSLNQYVFMAATRNGTAAALYWGTNPGSLSKVSGTVNSTGTPDTWTVCGRSPSDGSEWFAGVVDYLRTWGATVLTDAEVAAEAAATAPVKAGTWGVWPFGDNGSGGVSLNDTSGNARHLVPGSTPLTLVADVPLGRTLSRVTETGSVTPPVRSHVHLLNRVTGGGTVTAPARTHATTLGRVTELSTVTAAARSQAAAVGRVVEVGTLVAPVRSRTSALGRATEASQLTSPTRSQAAAVARVAEAGTVSPLIRSQAAALPAVVESSELVGFVRTRAAGLARIVESGVVAAPVHGSGHPLTGVLEAGQVSPLTRSRSTTVGRVVETGTATAPARGSVHQLVTVTEAGTLAAPARARVHALPRLTSSGTITAPRRGHLQLLTVVTEVGELVALVRGSRRALGRVVEASTVRPFSRSSSGGPVPGIRIGRGFDDPYLLVGPGRGDDVLAFRLVA